MCLSVLIDDKNIWAAPCPIMSPCPRCLYVQLYIREQIIARSAAAAVCAEILSAHQRMHTKDKAVSVNISKPGDHWEALMDLLPAYRSISYVKLGDGKATSFFGGPLAATGCNSICYLPGASQPLQGGRHVGA